MSTPDGKAVPPPAPPPPFLLPTSSVKRLVTKNLKDKQKLCEKKSDPRKTARECYPLLRRKTTKEYQHYFCCLRQVIQTVIQDGPKCGLVAIAMASQYFQQDMLSEDKLFQTAKKCGYTIHGEMFSAQEMCTLAASLLPCEGRVIQANVVNVTDALLHNQAVLIPYDRDHNNEPCLRKGQKAHWALLSGAMICCDTVPDWITQTRYAQDETEEFVNLYYLDDIPNGSNTREALLKEYDEKHLIQTFVFANQGKSLRIGLWDLQQLLQSNAQLTEVDQTLTSDYRKYPQGIETGLCCKMVVLSHVGLSSDSHNGADFL